MITIIRLPISAETREALKALKRGGESYDAVIRRLMLLDVATKALLPDEWFTKISQFMKEAEVS